MASARQGTTRGGLDAVGYGGEAEGDYDNGHNERGADGDGRRPRAHDHMVTWTTTSESSSSFWQGIGTFSLPLQLFRRSTVPRRPHAQLHVASVPPGLPCHVRVVMCRPTCLILKLSPTRAVPSKPQVSTEKAQLNSHDY